VNGASVPALRLDVRVRNGGAGLTVARQQNVYELDEVASFIWRQIDGARNLADIGAALAGEYGIDADEATADVAEALEPLLADGLITVKD
jgi:pyrroloquinoline quinone biosynthesis protein D